MVLIINRLSIDVQFRSLKEHAMELTLRTPDSNLNDHLHRLSDLMSARIGEVAEYKIIFGAEYLDKHK